MTIFTLLQNNFFSYYFEVILLLLLKLYRFRIFEVYPTYDLGRLQAHNKNNSIRVGMDDEGIYTCTVSNEGGQDHKNITLLVDCKYLN